MRLNIASHALDDLYDVVYREHSMRRYVIAQKVGKRMRKFRREAKLTQEEVSAKAGLHVTTYGRIERGEINPPLQTLNKIAQSLKISLSKLLD